jgi:hypothetical protein
MMTNTPSSIPRKKPAAASMHYDFLIEKALEAAQRYSGGIWTDYNHHDPGVTLLEQLCYAITDLSYRTHFDISDLLFTRAGQQLNISNDNLFYPPAQILPTDPLTIADYRRLFIDRIKHVTNAWVEPVTDDPAGYKGLCKILIQCSNELDENAREAIRLDVEQLYHQHRPLAGDLQQVVLLREDTISLAGKVHIAGDALGESVLAHIYDAVERYLNPELHMHNPLELMAKGINPQDIFNGPQPVYGFIDPADLRSRMNTVYVSRIRDIILKVPGVQSVDDFQVLQNGLRTEGDVIEIPEGYYPVVRNNLENYHHTPLRLHLFKERVQYDVDIASAQQLLDTMLAADQSVYYRKIDYHQHLTEGKFPADALNAYYSIQQELPHVYGLGTHDLHSGASPKRLAQRKQLKAYLLLFEQIMADYLAQLAGIGQILSINEQHQRTYYTQIPNDIPDLQEVISGTLQEYQAYLNDIAEDPSTRTDRQNRILDHLLARFGERFPADLLLKFQSASTPQSSEQVQQDMISARIRLLKDYPAISSRRGTAFNYQAPHWGTHNQSGLLLRLYHLLHIHHLKARSLVQPILEGAALSQYPDADDTWQDIHILTEEGLSISAFAKAENTYASGTFQYYTRHQDFIEDLFLFGAAERHYKIVRDASTTKYLVLYFSQITQKAIVVQQYDTPESARENLDKAIRKIAALDSACEGFHLIEHILLRPTAQQQYRFSLSNEQGSAELMTACQAGDQASQREVAEDVAILGKHPAQYEIEDKGHLEVILYDTGKRPVAQLCETFSSPEAAREAIARTTQYLTRLLSNRQQYELAYDIKLENTTLQEFSSEFPFSNTCTLIIPSWPFRFQNEEFRKLLIQTLEEHQPAHLQINCLYLSLQEMAAFESIYSRWLNESPRDQHSLQLIQFLRQYP